MISTASPAATTDPGPAQPGHTIAGGDRAGHPANGPARSGPSADRTSPAPAPNADQSAAVPRRRGPISAWPLLVLAAPAAVAVWSGWVGIGQMTGFGQIRPLPPIWDSLHVDTAVTLPIGVEAYAAFALRVWLTSNPVVSDRTRRFAPLVRHRGAGPGHGRTGRLPPAGPGGHRQSTVGGYDRGGLPARPSPRHGIRAGPPAAQRRLACQRTGSVRGLADR